MTQTSDELAAGLGASRTRSCSTRSASSGSCSGLPGRSPAAWRSAVGGRLERLPGGRRAPPTGVAAAAAAPAGDRLEARPRADGRGGAAPPSGSALARPRRASVPATGPPGHGGRDAGEPVRGPRGGPTGARGRVGQGRRREVVGHGQPRRGARPRRAHRVGLLDADIYGFSVPRMLGVEYPPIVVGRTIVPPGRPRGPGDLDGLLRRRGQGGRLAGADAPQGARAVPRRRPLGRPRLPRSSTCRRAPATSPLSVAQQLPAPSSTS